MRLYISFSLYLSKDPFSYTIDTYLGGSYGNQVNIGGSNEKWVLSSKDKLEYSFSKIPLIFRTKTPFLVNIAIFIFNTKLLVVAWILVIFFLLFSNFFPNIYWSWASAFITAYALLGVAVQVLLDQSNLRPAAKFVLVDDNEKVANVSVISYVVKQPILIKIIFFIFGLVGFISAVLQIIDIAKRFKWIP